MCQCGSKKKSQAGSNWKHVSPSGVTKVYRTESEARTAAAREGGKAIPS